MHPGSYQSPRGLLPDFSVRTPIQSVLAILRPRSLWSAPYPELLSAPTSESSTLGSISATLRSGNRHPRANARSIHSRISPPCVVATRDPATPVNHGGEAGSDTRAGAPLNEPPTPASCHETESVTCTMNGPRDSGCPSLAQAVKAASASWLTNW